MGQEHELKTQPYNMASVKNKHKYVIQSVSHDGTKNVVIGEEERTFVRREKLDSRELFYFISC